MKHVKFLIMIMFAVLPALHSFAGGVREPVLTVTDAPGVSRLISINWSDIKQPQNYRWGLYRFDLEDKTYSLVSEIDYWQRSYLDEDIDPPASKYFYKVGYVKKNADLPTDEPIRIRREDVIAQLSYLGEEANLGNIAFHDGNAAIPPKYSGKSLGRYSAGNEGIYVGIISFSGKVNDITQRPDGTPMLVPLDAPGRQVLLEYLARNYSLSKSNGTALYYADHKAIANLSAMEKEGTLPNNLDSVNIITFTDGTDTSSTDAEFTPIEGRDFRRRGTSAAYRTYISQQLTSRRIGGVKINAWAIGIQGKDIESNFEFSQALEAIASDTDHIAEFPVISQIDEGLTTIADGLNIYTPRMNLTFSTPAYPVNTFLRLTFDSNISSPDTSEYYVDARVGWDSNVNSYTLTLLDSYGIKLPGIRRIEGKRNDTGISYIVTVNNDFNESNVQLWSIQPGEESAGWMLNGVFEVEKTADFTHERKSAVVYLVLDCGLSLTPKEIDDIRTAMATFINKLYETSSSEIQLEAIEDYYPKKSITQNTAVITPVQPKVVRQPETAPPVSPVDQQDCVQEYPVPQTDSAPETHTTKRQPDTRYAPQKTRPVISQLPATPDTQTSRTPPPTYTNPQSAATQTSRIQPLVKVSPQDEQQRIPPVVTKIFYWVQLGSYTDTSRAQRAWNEFEKIGLGCAEIFSSNINGKIYYRVKAGPYTDRKLAEDMLARLKSYSAEYRTSFIINE
jgi:cell division protein FtsN